MASRQLRSHGAAQDPELGLDDFWLPFQQGAKKAKVKATKFPLSESGVFVTLKYSTDQTRALSISNRVHEVAVPSAASAFVSLDTSPKKQEQEVEKREDSVSDSAVDLKIFVNDSGLLNTNAPQSHVENPDTAEAAEGISPVAPSVSPVTSPEQDIPFPIEQPSRRQSDILGQLLAEIELDPSQEPDSTDVTTFTNGQTLQPAAITSRSASNNNQNTTRTITALSQQPHYSLEPSPEPHTRELPSQALSTIQSADLDPGPGLPDLFRSHPAVSQPLSAVSGPQSTAGLVTLSVGKRSTKQDPLSSQQRSLAKRDRSVTPPVSQQEPRVKRKPGRPRKEQRNPRLAVQEPSGNGYVPAPDMAPVRDPQDVSGSMKEIIQNIFDAQQTVVGFVPESQDLLVDRMEELTRNLAHVQNITNPNTSPNNPVHNIRIAPEIVDYVDDGRNPEIFTRDFVELVQRGNAVMNGKNQAFNSFAEIYALELKRGIGGVDKQVDAVMENAGLGLREENALGGRAQENGEKSG